jgi:type II restriction enzyme
MATVRQDLGLFGEISVVKLCACPRCKRRKSLIRLPPNFKCADVICDFCGFLAQVKASTVSDVDVPPKTILGAAWGPQRDRMAAAIYFPLYLVLKARSSENHSIFYLSADLQEPAMFLARKPLSSTARRPGWQGFHYNIDAVKDRLVRLV